MPTKHLIKWCCACSSIPVYPPPGSISTFCCGSDLVPSTLYMTLAEAPFPGTGYGNCNIFPGTYTLHYQNPMVPAISGTTDGWMSAAYNFCGNNCYFWFTCTNQFTFPLMYLWYAGLSVSSNGTTVDYTLFTAGPMTVDCSPFNADVASSSTFNCSSVCPAITPAENTLVSVNVQP